MKAEGYHWERKPYGCSNSLQKKMGAPNEVVEAAIFRIWVVRALLFKFCDIEDGR